MVDLRAIIRVTFVYAQIQAGTIDGSRVYERGEVQTPFSGGSHILEDFDLHCFYSHIMKASGYQESPLMRVKSRTMGCPDPRFVYAACIRLNLFTV
jgi:hypothetical protein